MWSRARALPAASPALPAFALAAIAFGAAGGAQIGRAAPTEAVAILIAGGLLAAAVPSFDASRRLHGGAVLSLLTLLTIVTGLSMSWSVAPDLSLQELGRTFMYLAVFTVAVVGARRLPRASRALLVGILLATLAVCLWAFASRIWPSSIGNEVLGPRLGAPFDYWNALGGMAALAVPATLWLAASRSGSRAGAVLAYPALGTLLLTIMLTQSRGALAGAIVATLLWLAFVPLRLRTAPVLIVAALGVAPITAWALSQDAFTKSLQPVEVRQEVAGTFGLLCAATLLTLLAAGYVAVRVRSGIRPSVQTRRRAGVVLASGLAVVGVAGIVAVGSSSGGLGELTAERSSVAASGADRLGSVSSTRGEAWRRAYDVFKDRPLLGRGADGFSLARLEFNKDPRAGGHAHGFIPQTMADLGLVGLFIALALVAAWLLAAGRTVGIRLRQGQMGPDWSEERILITGLALVAVAFGIQSAIDWTWFIPGPTAAALAAGGFVAGRGPLAPVGEPEPEPRVPAGGGRDPLRLILSGGVAVTALLCAWAVWQPERSQSATDNAVELANQGDTKGALGEAQRARNIDPYSPDPLYARATALAEDGRLVDAYDVLQQAVAEHPRNPETWLRLSQFELNDLGLAQRSLASAQAAATVDPSSLRVTGAVQRAQVELGRQQQELIAAQQVLQTQLRREKRRAARP